MVVGCLWVGCGWFCGGVFCFYIFLVWWGVFGVWLVGVLCWVCSGGVTKVTKVTCVGTLEGLEAFVCKGFWAWLPLGTHPSIEAALAL